MFDLFAFFATPVGMTATALLAAALVVLWEWRLVLIGLVTMQIAVATVVVERHDMPAQWALVQIAVVGLGAIILALSQNRAPASPSLRQSGTWTLRLLVVGLAYYGLRAISAGWVVPELDGPTTQMLAWLALTAALFLALGENPLYVGVGLLLWCMIVQAVIGPLLGIPALVAIIGIVELLLALACSYLILVDEAPETNAPQVITDVAFPALTVMANGANGKPGAMDAPPPRRERTPRRWMRPQPADEAVAYLPESINLEAEAAAVEPFAAEPFAAEAYPVEPIPAERGEEEPR